MKDVDIDTRTDRPDGWKQRTSSKVHKSLFCAPYFPPASLSLSLSLPLSPVTRPHILTRAPPILGRAALYTLHNDVYPVSTTGTIVPKVNI